MENPDFLQKILTSGSLEQTNTLFVFGVLMMSGVFGAIIAHRVKWLPVITSFMLLGVCIGPHALNLLSPEILVKSRIIIDVALGLVLYKLGCDVQLRHVIKTRLFIQTAAAECIFTFFAVYAAMMIFGYDALVAGLVAAIAVSSSPAVLVHVSEEMQAKGPVIHEAKSLVAVNNIVSFLLFSLLLPFALEQVNHTWFDGLMISVYRFGLAIIISLGVAYLMALIDRGINKEDEHYRFALIVGGITLTLGLTAMFEVSSLFATLMLGIYVRWFETQRHGLSTIELGSSGDVFFIALFVMAGANLHLEEFFMLCGLASLIALVRVLAKYGGLYLFQKQSERSHENTLALGLMLSPMAAMAIGLTQTLYVLAPDIAGKVTAIVFALVAILETLGPFATSHAIKITGESPYFRKDAAEKDKPEKDAAEPMIKPLPEDPSPKA
jgi:Kef-type K+ transport system membrane component KefB